MRKTSFFFTASLLATILFTFIAPSTSATAVSVVSAAADFTFASIGDGHVEINNFTQTVNQIKTLNPTLILFNGDLENAGVTNSEMDPMIAVLKNTGVFNNTFLVRGNHDDHVSGSAALWETYFSTSPNIKTPPAGITNYVEMDASSTYLTYSFDYGNSRFIGVDVPGAVDLLTSAEYTFLNNRLTNAESLGLTHAFIFFHGPEYCVEDTHCTCTAKTDSSCTPSAFITMVNNHPIVSATFHGHEHVLGHVHMDNSRVSSLTHPYEEFITSSAGNPYSFTMYPDRIDDDYTSHSLTSFALIAVSGSSFTVNFYHTGNTTPVWSQTFSNGSQLIPTATSVASNLNPSIYDASVTFTATVNQSAATGTVEFYDGATLLGSRTLSGGTPNTATYATLALTAAASPHSITAKYLGDSSYNRSTSTAINQVVNRKALTMSGLSVPASKVYNGTTTAVVNGTPALQAAEAPGAGTTGDGKPYTGDSVNITGTATGTYNSKDVATGSSVTFGGLSLGGTQAGNYSLTIQSPASATITAASLTITASNRSKTYGSAVSFAGTEFTAPALVSPDTITSVTLTSSGAAASANVAGSPYAIVPSAAVGTGLGNYTITYANGALTVTAKALSITANSSSKTYGSAVTFAGTEFTAPGLVSPDTITSVTLTSSGAAGAATVAGSPYAIVPSAAVGTGLGNYSITYDNGALTVDPKTLTVIATGIDKAFDGTTSASVTLTDNRVIGDNITDSYTTASFANADTGTGKTVYVNGISINGVDVGNYTLGNTTATTIANILAGGTTTVITNASALATVTVVGQSYPVTFSVTPSTIGTPTGNVTASDGTDTCVGTVASGMCDLTSTTSGIKSVIATYTGDDNFSGSISIAVPHAVIHLIYLPLVLR